MNVMQGPGPDLAYGTVPGAPRLNGKTFFLVFTYILQEDFAKISKVSGALRSDWKSFLSGLHLYLARRFGKSPKCQGPRAM